MAKDSKKSVFRKLAGRVAAGSESNGLTANGRGPSVRDVILFAGHLFLFCKRSQCPEAPVLTVTLDGDALTTSGAAAVATLDPDQVCLIAPMPGDGAATVKTGADIGWDLGGTAASGRGRLRNMTEPETRRRVADRFAAGSFDQCEAFRAVGGFLLAVAAGGTAAGGTLAVDGVFRSDAASPLMAWGWVNRGETAGLFAADEYLHVVVPMRTVRRIRHDVAENLEAHDIDVCATDLGFNAVTDGDFAPATFRLLVEDEGVVHMGDSQPVAAVDSLQRRARTILQDLSLDGGCMADVALLMATLGRPTEIWRDNIATDNFLVAPLADPPRLSIVIPYYADPYFILDQIAMQAFAPDDVEWIFVCDDPHLAKGMAEILRSRLPFMSQTTRLVTVTDNLGFGCACNLGASLARAPHVLFMNSDVYTECFDAVTFALAAMERDDTLGCLGFTLTYEDETIQHNGIKFMRNPGLMGLYGLEHPAKGLPASWSVIAMRDVDAVTAALMLVRKADWPDGHFFDTSYIIGDFEDGDLNLTVTARGQRVAIVEAPGLYHLERQSFRSMGSSDWRLAVTMINCARFNHKWQDQLAAY